MRKKLITARQKESQNNLKEKKKMTKEVCTETDGMSKKTETKTKLIAKTTVARIPALI